MTRLHLMRHGKAQPASHQTEGELFSTGDEPLSKRGREQAEAMGRMIAAGPRPIDAVHSSTAIRSRETAEIVAGVLPGEREVVEHPDLFEVPYAEPGSSYDDTLREIVRVAQDLREDPDPTLATGVSWREVTGRFAEVLEAIVDEHDNPLVVAHGAQNRAWLSSLLGMPDHRLFFLEQDHACLNVVAYDGGHPVVQKLNVTPEPLASQSASLQDG